jgi:hypothetical protein
MEQAFGHDFSSVQAYQGKGNEMDALGANAAARGEQIAFKSATPDVGVVAHELAHVVQHRNAGGGAAVMAEGAAPASHAAEHEAEAVAAKVRAGEQVSVTGRPGSGLMLDRAVGHSKIPDNAEVTFVRKLNRRCQVKYEGRLYWLAEDQLIRDDEGGATPAAAAAASGGGETTKSMPTPPTATASKGGGEATKSTSTPPTARASAGGGGKKGKPSRGRRRRGGGGGSRPLLPAGQLGRELGVGSYKTAYECTTDPTMAIVVVKASGASALASEMSSLNQLSAAGVRAARADPTIYQLEDGRVCAKMEVLTGVEVKETRLRMNSHRATILAVAREFGLERMALQLDAVDAFIQAHGGISDLQFFFSPEEGCVLFDPATLGTRVKNGGPASLASYLRRELKKATKDADGSGGSGGSK